MRKTGLMLLLSVLLVGCGGNGGDGKPEAAEPSPQGDPSVSASPTAQPKTMAEASRVAQQEADAFAAGDWGGAWDLWTDAGKRAVSRADYIRYHTTCTQPGVPVTVVNVRPEGANQAVVQYKTLGLRFAVTLSYANGRWQYAPPDPGRYAAGVDALIAKKRAAGTCGT